MSSRLDHHTPKYEDQVGNFGLSYHLEMLKDTERVGRIRQALDEVLQPDGIHCELGIGTGVFAIYAASKCRKVYAVEKDPAIYAFAKKNIQESIYADKIELYLADGLDFVPEEKADTLLVEMMSIWCINEPQVTVMNHARKHILRAGGVSIPSRIVNLVELGHYDFEVMGVPCPSSLPQFSGITAPRIMTQSAVFNTFDFGKANTETIEDQIQIKALVSGNVNCARLSSLVQLSPSITFYSTDSLMPLTIVPLRARAVQAGDELTFYSQFKVRTDLERSRFELR
ncbi:MAG: SAM-dependent methyltransferase [Saprospiraceae bacterium]|nr:SAM-dependent methyltransferase [Saprospiraceae bacterium]